MQKSSLFSLLFLLYMFRVLHSLILRSLNYTSRYVFFFWHAPLHYIGNTTCCYIWCLQSLFLLFLVNSWVLFLVPCSFLWSYLTVVWILQMLCSVFWWACLYLWASYLLPLLRLSGVLSLREERHIRAVCVPLFDCRFRMDRKDKQVWCNCISLQ
jgi:hypothetical protein